MTVPLSTNQTLGKRLSALQEEYAAIYTRLGQTLDPVEELKLKRRASDLESEIRNIEAKFQQSSVGDNKNQIDTAPFKGLFFFEEADAHLFFGRNKLIVELVNHLYKSNFLALVGNSGSGKSSLVRAGLIPALRKGELNEESILFPESCTLWPICVVTPTGHPLESLAIGLTKDTTLADTSGLLDELNKSDHTLHLYVRKLLYQTGRERYLLIIDQFEELFTLCKDENERKAFIDNLITAVHPDTAGPIVLILIIRADFMHYCIDYEELDKAMKSHQISVRKMKEAELREAIEQPAIQNGLQFESGLVDRFLIDVSNAPGQLPLLSHALFETWERREGDLLTLHGYLESGGVQAAIAKTADRVYDQYLNPDQKTISWGIFSRLIELGESSPETRRRATFEELISNPNQVSAIQEVLNILVKHRLITTSDSSIEMAHEALIANWPKLKQWLDTNREGLIIHKRLSEAALEWNKYNRHEDFLMTGKQLNIFEQWQFLSQKSLNIIEREFLEASYEKTRKLARKKLVEKRVNQFAISFLPLTLITLIILALFRLPPFTPIWLWTNGPVGGDTWEIAVDPNIPDDIFIGYAKQGVYKSEDGGHTWFPANTGLSTTLISKLLIDSDTSAIYAITNEDTLFSSKDGGSNWNPINEGLPLNTIIRDFTLYNGPPKELYLATWGHGIWTTPVDEIRWQQKTWTGLESPSIHQVKIVEGSLTIVYASSNHKGLFRSLDLGANWELVTFPEGDITQLGVAPWNKELIYIYDATSGPYVSQNGGLTWLSIANQIAGTPRSYPYFYSDGEDHAIFVSTYNGQVFRSNESGDDWQSVWSNLPLALIRDIRILPSTNNILLSTSNGIYISSDGGNSWLLTGPEVLSVSVIVSLADNLDTHTGILAATSSGIYYTHVGENWIVMNGGLKELTISRLVVTTKPSSQEIYAISDEGNLYNFVINENRWQPIILPTEMKVTLVAPGTGDASSIFAVTEDNQVYQTSNKANWHYLWQAPSTITDILVTPWSSETLYLATSNNGIYRSNDAGAVWFPVNDGLTNPTVNDIVASNNDSLLYAATNSGIYVSKDGEQSWSYSTTGLTAHLVTSVAVHPVFDAMVYAGTPGGIFVSYDFGKTWQAQDTGLQVKDISSIDVDEQYVYIGTSHGVYYMEHPVIPTLLWRSNKVFGR